MSYNTMTTRYDVLSANRKIIENKQKIISDKINNIDIILETAVGKINQKGLLKEMDILEKEWSTLQEELKNNLIESNTISNIIFNG